MSSLSFPSDSGTDPGTEPAGDSATGPANSERPREALLQSEARYRTLVQALGQVVWTAAPNGEFVSEQAGWCEFTGQAPAEAAGWGWLDAVHADDKLRIRQTWSRATEARAIFRAEFRLLREDGTFRWVSARGAPVLQADGNVREWIGTFNDVDELRRVAGERRRLYEAERRARAEAERLSTQLSDTLESVSEAFFAYDREWRLVRYNGAAKQKLRELGSDPAAAIGCSVWDVIPQLKGTRLADAMRRAARDRIPVEVEEQLFGPGLWFDYHVYPTPDGIAVWALDVTERRRATRTLEFLAEASRLLTASLDYESTLGEVARLAVPFLADCCVVDLRTSAGAVRRVAVVHVNGERQTWIEELGRSTDLAESRTVIGRVLRGGSPELDAEAANVDDSPDRAAPQDSSMSQALGARSCMCVPLVGAAGVLGAVLYASAHEGRRYGPADLQVAEEIARRMSAAVQTAQLLESERLARGVAESANQAKMDFLAMMSHELRTPLNAIAGYAELLEMGLRGPVTPEQAGDLQSIRRNERYLLTLVEEVLSFAKLDAGRVELDMGEVRVRLAMESAASLIAHQIDDNGLRVQFGNCSSTLTAVGDLEKVQQIFVNLLSNAVKFTASGGIITLECEAVGSVVEMRVRDTGIGIPSDQFDRIFEPFVQLDSGLSRASAGTGLGLAISRELARAMGGELTVKSEMGRGSEFTLTLPLSSES